MQNIESEIKKHRIKLGWQGVGLAALGSMSGVCFAIVYKSVDYLVERNQEITPDEYSILFTAGFATATALAFTSALFISTKNNYQKIRDLRRKQKVGELYGNKKEYF